MQPLPSTEAILNAYDTWTAQQHTRAASDIKFEADAFRDTRLVGGGDSTFNRGEVAEMLSAQLQAVIGAAMKNHDGTAERSRALMKAILGENDRQRVAVDIDAVGILNQGSRVTALEAAEQRTLASKGSIRLGALPSLNSSEVQAKQLSEAHEEIRRLNERMRAMAAQFEAAMRDKSQLNDNVLTMQDTVALLQRDQEQLTQQQQQQLKQQQEMTQQQLQQQNAQYRSEISSLRQQVVDAQKELTGKLSQSVQFTTLKRMLNEKNDLCKTLRASLQRYDPAAAAVGGDDDIEAADDDD